MVDHHGHGDSFGRGATAGLLLAPFLIAKIMGLRKDEQASARTARYSPKRTKENVVASNLMPTSK